MPAWWFARAAGPQRASARGSCDERPLEAVLIGVADLLADHPEIVERDVNPLVARGGQSVAVDALVIVERTNQGGNDGT